MFNSNKKRISADEQTTWNGYDHLMNLNPSGADQRYDMKASIYDVNAMRDSVFTDRERFSFCLSPPKEKLSFKKMKSDDGTASVIKATKRSISPKRQQQGISLSSTAPASSLLPLKEITFNKQPQQHELGGTNGINKPNNRLPPSQQNQQNHQYNIRKLPSTNTINLNRINSNNNSINTMVESNSNNSNSNGNLMNTNTLKSISSSPKSSPSKAASTLSRIPASPRRATTSSTTSLSSIQASPNKYNTPTQTSSTTTLKSKPQTPTKLTSTITTATLNSKPSTPNRPVYPTLGKLNTTPSIDQMSNSKLQLQQQQTSSSRPQPTIINNSSPTIVDHQIIEKYENRIKLLEIEHRLIKHQVEEKENTIQDLTSRLGEVEFQLATLMVHVKTVFSERGFI
ncbi:hypothetical protein CYY_006700 [Polysphondylium violaceum]|uniref:Uncharacterized protein n=1 Tax=Polysphondylium violaceum TaxID=133409 RepID=A0A8J4V2W0_9MYCE|nr:hypothetical protein CYY_006700 [Polysphondylium violaceum]